MSFIGQRKCPEIYIEDFECIQNQITTSGTCGMMYWTRKFRMYFSWNHKETNGIDWYLEGNIPKRIDAIFEGMNIPVDNLNQKTLLIFEPVGVGYIIMKKKQYGKLNWKKPGT